MQSNRTCISSSAKYLYSAFCFSTCDVQTDCLNFTLLNMVMTLTRTNTHSVLIVTRPLHQSFISAMILITLVIRQHKISKQTQIDATLLWVTTGGKKMRKKKKNERMNGKEQQDIYSFYLTTTDWPMDIKIMFLKLSRVLCTCT